MSGGASGPVLVTGGAGFIGSNLADRLAGEGRDVVVYDALSRPGVEANLAWLQETHGRRIRAIRGDVRDSACVSAAAADCSAIFHLAAQVAVTTSLAAPRDDAGINVTGTLNVLEAARARGVPVVFASTNKVYGDLADLGLEATANAYVPTDPGIRDHGVSEARPLDFHTPYGCSKGAADQYVLDYARSFGVPTCVLRMSCIYGPRQRGTEDQGWVAHFLIRALAGRGVTVYGDGRQVRDILDVGDAVEAYVAALARIGTVSGQAFNLGGGPGNAVSLRQVLAEIGAIAGREIEVAWEDWRPGDQRYYVSDARRAMDALGLSRPREWREGLLRLAEWLREDDARAAPLRPMLLQAAR